MTANIKKILLQNSLMLFLLMLIAFFAIFNKNYLTASNFSVILRQASLLALLGIAQTIVIITGNIDLSIGSIIALTTVAFSHMIKAGKVHYVLVVLMIIGMGALLGALTGFIITKLHIPPFIATFATNYAYRGVAWLIMGSSVIYSLPEKFRFIGMGDLFGIPITIIFEIVIGLIVFIILRKTVLGSRAYFIGANRKSAEYSGINTVRTIIVIYMISSAVAAFTGAIYVARLNTAEPALGTSFSLDSIATSLIGGTQITGGRGGVWGTMVGAIILSIIKNGMNFMKVSSEMQSVVLGVIIIVAVYYNQLIANKLNEWDT